MYTIFKFLVGTSGTERSGTRNRILKSIRRSGGTPEREKIFNRCSGGTSERGKKIIRRSGGTPERKKKILGGTRNAFFETGRVPKHPWSRLLKGIRVWIASYSNF